MHVVLFRNELNQLQRHDKGQDNARDGQNHIVRQRSDHAVDAAVPALGRSAHLSGDARHAAVHVVKQSVHVVHDAADQQLLQPFGEFLPYQIQWALPSFPAAPALGADAAKDSCGRLTEQAGEQGYENDADERHAAASHELFYPQLGVKLCSMAGGGVQKIYMVFLREPSRRDRAGSDLFHLRDGFEIKMNFDRNVSCFIFVNALMHDDFFD